MRRHFWILTLSAAEGIPTSIVTYVALLMFLQADSTPAMATCYCGLLFIPWVMKSFLRQRVRQFGHFRRQIQLVELATVGTLMGLAFVFLRYTRVDWWLFAGLFLLSLLTAWHELAARMYYERMLRPRQQRFFNGPKTVSMQSAVVLTYGLLIMFVGALQVIYRRIPRSWNEGCYLVAGVFMLFSLVHLFTLRRPHVGNWGQNGSTLDAVRSEIHVIERIRQKPCWLLAVSSLFLLLLPQGLMFYSRVIFLLSPRTLGGLGCTLLDVGFAQGIVGVIAFSIGVMLGRQLLRWVGMRRLFWWMSVALGISPLLYLMMSYDPPQSLMVLSVATFQAQFFFGFGLNIVMFFVRYISGERYRNTIHYLYIPLVATAFLLPLSVSGWLVGQLGFRTYFWVDVLAAPVAWFFLRLLRVNRRLDVPQLAERQ